METKEVNKKSTGRYEIKHESSRRAKTAYIHKLADAGYSNKDIAILLGISESTVNELRE